MNFAETIRALPVEEPTLETCHKALGLLIGSLNATIIGQEQMTRRVCQALILDGHVLVESIPGLGKTKLVQTAAESVGMKFKRIQYFPDMLPSDLIGRNIIVKQNGALDLAWVYGPIFHPIVVADEINRASPKVQAATLECMQERTCTLLDRPRPLTVYHRTYRNFLKNNRQGTCFGLRYPHPDDPARVYFVVFATQNPIEMEGTYPLSEAQLDRFLFKLIVHPPAIDTYDAIIRANLHGGHRTLPDTFADEETIVGPAAVTGTAALPSEQADFRPDSQNNPLWLKTACFFEFLRQKLITGPGSMHDRLLHHPAQRGLWDRIRLIIALSHYRIGGGELSSTGSESLLPVAVRGEFQETLRGFLAMWNCSAPTTDEKCATVVDEARSRVNQMLTDNLFQYVETGVSPRGLIDWPRAAVVESFLAGCDDVRREHFRAVADDVLRHRIRLNPQARADGISSQDVIGLLINTLLPVLGDADAEKEQDAVPLLGTQPRRSVEVR